MAVPRDASMGEEVAEGEGVTFADRGAAGGGSGAGGGAGGGEDPTGAADGVSHAAPTRLADVPLPVAGAKIRYVFMRPRNCEGMGDAPGSMPVVCLRRPEDPAHWEPYRMVICAPGAAHTFYLILRRIADCAFGEVCEAMVCVLDATTADGVPRLTDPPLRVALKVMWHWNVSPHNRIDAHRGAPGECVRVLEDPFAELKALRLLGEECPHVLHLYQILMTAASPLAAGEEGLDGRGTGAGVAPVGEVPRLVIAALEHAAGRDVLTITNQATAEAVEAARETCRVVRQGAMAAMAAGVSQEEAMDHAMRAADKHGYDVSTMERPVMGLGEPVCARLFAQTATALAHAHSFGIVHLDVSGENILIALESTRTGGAARGGAGGSGAGAAGAGAGEGEGESERKAAPGEGEGEGEGGEDGVPSARLSDFGLAAQMAFDPALGDGLGGLHPLPAGRRVGKPAYVAPEVFCGLAHGTAADWWSAGVTLFLSLTGALPYDILFRDEAYVQLVRERRWPEESAWWVGPAARDLVLRLLTEHPDERASDAEVLAHPWLTGGAFDATTSVEAGVAEAAAAAASAAAEAEAEAAATAAAEAAGAGAGAGAGAYGGYVGYSGGAGCDDGDDDDGGVDVAGVVRAEAAAVPPPDAVVEPFTAAGRAGLFGFGGGHAADEGAGDDFDPPADSGGGGGADIVLPRGRVLMS